MRRFPLLIAAFSAAALVLPAAATAAPPLSFTLIPVGQTSYYKLPAKPKLMICMGRMRIKPGSVG